MIKYILHIKNISCKFLFFLLFCTLFSFSNILSQTITPQQSFIAGSTNKIQVNNYYSSNVKKILTNEEYIKSLFWIFSKGIFGGILSVFTPYVYALLPITVGYLTLRSRKKSEGKYNIFVYSLSIFAIFSILGLLITGINFIIGQKNLKLLYSNWIFNLVFFRIFIVLGFSFLGAFEIKLPARWALLTDAKARKGNFWSIFNMALTLPIVTFSSTGPIVGLVLVMASDGGTLGPLAGMLGFSLGLSTPFMFPFIINFIASSIAVLNQVKVVLGLFSVLISLKFLSIAVIILGWNDMFDRELFIGIWAILCIVLGLYMLGKIKFNNDYVVTRNNHNQEFVTLSRLFIAIASFVLAIYLIPGIFGAPLKGVNGFLPAFTN